MSQLGDVARVTRQHKDDAHISDVRVFQNLRRNGWFHLLGRFGPHSGMCVMLRRGRRIRLLYFSKDYGK